MRSVWPTTMMTSRFSAFDLVTSSSSLALPSGRSTDLLKSEQRVGGQRDLGRRRLGVAHRHGLLRLCTFLRQDVLSQAQPAGSLAAAAASSNRAPAKAEPALGNFVTSVNDIDAISSRLRLRNGGGTRQSDRETAIREFWRYSEFGPFPLVSNCDSQHLWPRTNAILCQAGVARRRIILVCHSDASFSSPFRKTGQGVVSSRNCCERRLAMGCAR